jgi:hypothetical protein
MLTTDPDIPNTNASELNAQISESAGQPLVLFPVRLETRFFGQSDGNYELRVRIYPDKIHTDTHEPELTADEITWGQHFWNQTREAGNDEERKKAAWHQLADRFDTPRAAWIARVLSPLNSEDPLQPLQFPSVPTKKEAWTRAPQTSVLPDFWTVLGYQAGRLLVNVRGKPIKSPLSTGPDPTHKTAADTSDADELFIDPGMKWMVDFDSAEENGMGIRANLANNVAVQGLDYLLVLGLKAGHDGTDLLTRLFDAHHYTDGLMIVPQGTPSNNTEDAPSGFSSKDIGHEISYIAERTSPIIKPGDGTNADILTSAFGIPADSSVFVNIPNSSAKEQLDAYHMNRLLWPATMGYFLSQMMCKVDPNESSLSAEDIAWTRQHFHNYVRATGPIPAIRIGKQPYGILPVTSLDTWKPKIGQEQSFARDIALKEFLKELRKVWRNNLMHVPRLGRTDNATQDISDVLSMDGISLGYSIRQLMGETYLKKLWSAISPGEQSFWWEKQQELTKTSLDALRLKWKPRLSRSTYSGLQSVLKGPVVQLQPDSEHLAIDPNYIDKLLKEHDFEKILKENLTETQPQGLLYSLLRHALLLEYWAAALNILYPTNQGQNQAYWRDFLEQEIIGTPSGISNENHAPVWELLKRPVPGHPDQLTIQDYLQTLDLEEPDTSMAAHVSAFLEFRKSLTYIKPLSSAKLHRNFAGSLDLCSHRLDAWITSFATQRLEEIRKTNPTGALIGGYGWVINLKPNLSQNLTITPPGHQTPVYQEPNNPGFIHAPSLAQATTAAVLRSGHLTYVDPQTTDNLLSIDLSSERVRLATWLLDGVRQGQPLGALLGYRFERRLHEVGKPEYISYFRELAPLVANKLEQTKEAVENIAANNVVDGLKLNDKWSSAKAGAAGSKNQLLVLFDPLLNNNSLFPNNVSIDKFEQELANSKQAIENVLNTLDDSVDAVSDALLAESTYQIVRGNPLRANYTVDSIAGGDTPPPELEFARTPRSGIALTHRLVTLFNAHNPISILGWNPVQVPFRANAEPYLNAWAAKLLVNPSDVRCLIERLETDSENVLETKELRLNELHLAPLDFIYAVEGGQQGEVEQRILNAVMVKPDGFNSGSVLRINPGRKSEWEANELSYGEFNELLRTTRQLLTNARPITADDLNVPERNVEFSVDIAELNKRTSESQQALRDLTLKFNAELAKSDTANLTLLREFLLQSGGFGVTGAVPLSPVGESDSDRNVLLTQVTSTVKELQLRLDQLSVLNKQFNPSVATLEEQRDHGLAQMQIIFGKAFVVVPRFMVANPAELKQAMANSNNVQDGDPMASVTWLQRMARVRDCVGRLNNSLLYAEALNTGEKINLTVAQLPHKSDDRWVGLSLKAGEQLPAGKLSLVVQAYEPIDFSQAIAGILIDEWVEVVPNSTEDTGITFQYDQPDAAPPQTILIAVPPDLETPWTVGTLQQVLLETLDLAKIRAVDLQSLEDGLGHYLPALYFAANTNNDTVSTDFTKLK